VHLERTPQRTVATVAPPGRPNTSLEKLCADVADAVTGPLSPRNQRVALALAPYLRLPDLLPDSACRCSPDRYVRHLLYAGIDYTVLALVWRPRQMSPVHAHQTWCAFGMYRGWMVETFFAPGPPGTEPRGCVQRRVGDISHASADPDSMHRLANLGTETAISIHVYGAPYDRLGDQVNQICAD
jgi:predicted metal-dependent enzyme (double-stranded beta helix superfamily)